MPFRELPPFTHRHNKNLSHDSICTRCFMTVATSVTEEDLTPHEEAHVCDRQRIKNIDHLRRTAASYAKRTS